jgi:hypothetical protein
MTRRNSNVWNRAGTRWTEDRLADATRTQHVSICLHHIYTKGADHDPKYSIGYDCLKALVTEARSRGIDIVRPPDAGSLHRGLSITIDDGLVDTVNLAGQLSDELEVPIGFYVITNWMRGPRQTWRDMPTLLADEVDDLLAGHRHLYVGSHGEEHVAVTRSSYDSFVRSQRHCVERWGERATESAALPFGDDRGVPEAGLADFTHLTGLGRSATPRSLPRVPIRDHTTYRGLSAMASNLSQGLFRLRHKVMK